MIRDAFVHLLFAVTCVAAENVHAGFLYTTNTDGASVTITGYTNSVPDDLIIPTNINGLTVTAIGENAFGEVSNLTNVAIPNTVTMIEEDAFSAAGLTTVTIPYGVTNIGEGAFADCEKLTNASIPESVATIGQDAFGDTALTRVTVPGSVINFGDGAFSIGDTVTNVIIESGITSLGPGHLFEGCGLLPSLTIPATVTNLGEGTFQQCRSLTNVLFMGSAPIVNSTVFQNFTVQIMPHFAISNYYTATAYYLPGTTGWDQFMSNTLMAATGDSPTNEFVPTVLWNPTIITSGPDFRVQNGQFGFDFQGTRDIPIAIEACDDLSQTNWTRLVTRTVPFGPGHFGEPFQSNAPARFYRIAFP